MNSESKLLLVGPKPPPFDGTSVSFDLFCAEAERVQGADSIRVIDSSPGYLKEKSSIIGLSSIGRSLRILGSFLVEIRRAERVILFGSTGFLLSMVPILLGICRLLGKPCWIRAFGGSLDIFEEKIHPLARHLLRRTLSGADGLLVQTAWLEDYYRPLISAPILRLPGYRRIEDGPVSVSEPGSHDEVAEQDELRLVYVGHVRPEKGIFELIEAVEHVHNQGYSSLRCHIYGPIYPSCHERFTRAVDRAAGIEYGGILEPEQVISKLREYDGMVFPTYYEGEGHPGVLIEAMIAGLPILTTRFRAIPELIEEGGNGLLVPPRDSVALSEALVRLIENPELRVRMARGSHARSRDHDVSSIVPPLLDQIMHPSSRGGLEPVP